MIIIILFPVVLFLILIHNDYHKYPSSVNFGGVRWYEIDPVISLLDRVKVIKIKSLSLKRGGKVAGIVVIHAAK